VDSTQDFKDSTQVTGEVDQGGLGLPDRDYYTRDDPKSKEQRAEYQKHVAKMFELMGDPAATAADRSPDGDGPGDAARQGIPNAGGAARS
jgi:putative endopeptidase